MLTREKALDLVKEYTKNNNLVKHMLAVEASMRAYAKKFEEDENLYGVTGLVHDFDYEIMKDKHPSQWGYKILREKGVDERTIQAIVGHVDRDAPQTRPDNISKALFAVDELSGLVVAIALLRPDQISGLEVKSVMKKFKDKTFAKGVNREDIIVGAKELNVSLEEHIQIVIDALRGIKEELGLK